MNTTIINDCRDANAQGRQVTRAVALLGGPVSFIGVSHDLEAAGNLIDTLDAYGEAPGVVLVNIAPRNGRAKKWKNGTPFGYFWYKKILVVSSVDGLTLSLVKKLKLIDVVHVLDIPTVVNILVEAGRIDRSVADYITGTQFRSFDFLPRIAEYLLSYTDAASEVLSINDVADAPPSVWWVDNFGNCKTTLVLSDIAGDAVHMKTGDVPYIAGLKDVPDVTCALITGSSGLGESRFLEIVVQGESAAQALGLSSGDLVL